MIYHRQFYQKNTELKVWLAFKKIVTLSPGAGLPLGDPLRGPNLISFGLIPSPKKTFFDLKLSSEISLFKFRKYFI